MRQESGKGRAIGVGLGIVMLNLSSGLGPPASSGAAVPTTPGAAHRSAPMRVGRSIVLSAVPCSVALAPAPGVPRAVWRPDQDIRRPPLAALLATSSQGSTHTRSFVLRGYTPIVGRNGHASVRFQSILRVGARSALQTFVVDGTTRVDWRGPTPSLADAMTLGESFFVDGSHLSVTGAPRPGFSIRGHTMRWSVSWTKVWGVYHRYANCPIFRAAGPVTAVYEDAGADIQVGSTFYSIGAHASAHLTP